MTETVAEGTDSQTASSSVSGKLVVLAMFAFGLLLTGLLYGYWELHTRPFRALQEAIARTIPGSSPRVTGGKHKSHQPGARNTLRIIVRVDYNPLEPANAARRDDLAGQILDLARTHHDLSPYEIIEMHFQHPVPERPAEFWSSVRTPAEWEAFSAERAGSGRPS